MGEIPARGDQSETSVQTHTIIKDLPCDLGKVASEEDEFEQHLVAFGFDEEAVHQMIMGFREALINAMQHGNKLDPAKTVHLEFTISPEKIRVVITDQGEGYQPDEVPDPREEIGLQKNSGRGLLIIKTFYDEVAQRNLMKDGAIVGHEIIMVKRPKKIPA